MTDNREAGNIVGVIVLFIVFVIVLFALCYCLCAGCYTQIRDWRRNRVMTLPVNNTVNNTVNYNTLTN